MKKTLILALLSLFNFACSDQIDNHDPVYISEDFVESRTLDTVGATNDVNKKEEKGTADETEEKKEEPKPKSPHTFTGNVALVSDYRFRGISQTMRRPAIQGGVDYSHTGGGYLGTWASNVDGTAHYYNNTSMEWDFYGGYKGKLPARSLSDFAYNFGFLFYYYPGGKTNAKKSASFNTGEFYIELSYKWFSVKCWRSVTDYFGVCSRNPAFNWKRNRADRPNGNSHGSVYVEANGTFDLLKKVSFGCLTGGKLNLLLHVGYLSVRNYGHLNYTDWKAVLTQEFDRLNVFIAYVGTNAKHAYYDVPDNAHHPSIRHLGAQGVVIGGTRTF